MFNRARPAFAEASAGRPRHTGGSMKRTARWLVFAPLIVLLPHPLWAQVSAPNAIGVSAGHEHFRAVDLDAADRFWISLGGVHTFVGKRQIVKFPGVMVK
jgi:hypothetical protein